MIERAREARAKANGLANALQVKAGIISQEEYTALRKQVKDAEAEASKLEGIVRKQLIPQKKRF